MTKTILITGASGGVGTQLIEPLSKAGYNLALHYNTNLQALEEHLDRVKPATKVACIKGDLTREEEVKELVSTALDLFGSIDILVNNAGISSSSISWKMDLEHWNNTLNVNLTSTFLVCKHVIPHMRKNEWGRIINNSSVVAQSGMPGTTAYAASKAGIEGFSKSLAKELVSKNITVNTLSYGYMDAGMINVLTYEIKEIVRESIPQKRFGPVDNIAGAIKHLASNEADYVTGQVININGGLI